MQKSKRFSRLAGALILVSAVCQAHSAYAAAPAGHNGIHVDVPVVLKEAKAVFNMDHLAFAGDMPIGLMHMGLMVKAFDQHKTPWKIVAIFHGPAGYMTLNDSRYDRVRKVKTGNPYKGVIARLIHDGVQIEECAVTMKFNKWTNADLLPGVKVNSGANGRIIQLVQQGYVQLQP